jgi:hypothetical protein
MKRPGHWGAHSWAGFSNQSLPKGGLEAILGGGWEKERAFKAEDRSGARWHGRRWRIGRYGQVWTGHGKA